MYCMLARSHFTFWRTGRWEEGCFNTTLVTASRIGEHYDQKTDTVNVPRDSGGGHEDHQVKAWIVDRTMLQMHLQY